MLSLEKGSVNHVTPDLRCWGTELVRYPFDGWLNSGYNLDLYQKENSGPRCEYQSYVTPHYKYGPFIHGMKIFNSDGSTLKSYPAGSDGFVCGGRYTVNVRDLICTTGVHHENESTLMFGL